MRSGFKEVSGHFFVTLRIWITRFTLCFFFLSSFFYPPAFAADENEVKVFKVVLPHRSLLTSPQFLVLDDFNTKKLINQFGALWQTKARVMDLSIQKIDARNPDRGASLRAAYHLADRENAVITSRLNDLDVSQAEALVFKCRVQNVENQAGRFLVILTDSRRTAARYEFTAQCPAGDGWNDVMISLDRFRGLDWDRLFSVQFVIQAGKGKNSGTFQLDEIAFFGFNDVAFESNRDNLRGFPRVTYDETKRKQLVLEKRSSDLLKRIAMDTWNFFQNARDNRTHLVVDHVRVGDAPLAAAYTSPTNIAMDLLATVAAFDLEFITREQAVKRVLEVIATLNTLRRYEGFFYNFYDTRQLAVTRSYISSVDNGWLAIALVILRQAFPEETAAAASAILDSFDFEAFLDPENNQLVVGFDVPKREFGNFHYGMLVTEARAMSYYAIGKGDIPADHWWFLYRTLPDTWKWQTQVPQGKQVAREGVDYFQGYYEDNGKKFVPSWGGSLFEILMPTLVINEEKLAKKGLGANDRIMTELHRDYALKEKGYPLWGISPAATGNGRRWQYQEFGIKKLGAKGYPDRGFMTPHVGFLALQILPKDAIRNIRKLLTYENTYGEYGVYDSVNLRNMRVNPQYLALDQGMILVAICNYLKKNSIQKRFHADPVGQNAEKLLNEEFF